jgi:phosphinothricin acetyltransferase
MLAVIGTGRNEACIALHRTLGFSNVGTLKAVGLKFGQWEDTVIMQRHLGEGEWSLPRE